jgi:hypothetical protein
MPKGKRARSTPLVPILAERLAALSTRRGFSSEDDYVFCTGFGERLSDATIRAVFYAAVAPAGMGHKREKVDRHGNPQIPIRVHDLRHVAGGADVDLAPRRWGSRRVRDRVGVLSNGADLCDSHRRKR